eukprot:TRINITY_DN2877_c0_g1_i1.p1 TRINITY_DN2877_c0_g1~~TRINITY_DN2877_c0_g1_i1.p1  ORF type:complete len:204 (-),score=30.98 TRINITY_DN2877_c0_g1_i1:260-871(-)
MQRKEIGPYEIDVNYPDVCHVWIKDAVKTFTWKKFVKHLSNKKAGKYSHVWDPEEEQLLLARRNEEEMVPTKSMSITQAYVMVGEVIIDGNGMGEKITLNGDRFRGEWKDWEMDGQCEEIYTDGDRFSGMHSNDSRAGIGTNLLIMTTGTMLYSDGASYHGNWEDGVRHGFGKFTSATGFVYNGNWEDDEPTGTSFRLNCRSR